MAVHRIIIKGTPLRDEGTASGVITPGHLVKSTAAGVAVHSVAGGAWQGAVAVEREMVGDTIDDAYAISDTVLLAWPRNGDVLNGLVAAAAAAIVKGDALEPAGDGTLRKFTGLSTTGVESETIAVEDLAAGVDIAERLEFSVPAALNGAVITGVTLLSKGAPAGIDAGNTCLVKVTKLTVGDIVGKTFTNLVVFPAANATVDMGAVTNGTLTTGDLIGIVVTNGATADPPAFELQIELGSVAAVEAHPIGFAEAAVDNSIGATPARLKWRRA